jgi:hypothetical protein
MIDITQILVVHYPDSHWTLDGQDYEGLKWLSDTPKPTKVELEKFWIDIKNDLLLTQVKNSRQLAYSKTADPLFFKFQAGEATEQEWLDARAKVASDNPYPKETN